MNQDKNLIVYPELPDYMKRGGIAGALKLFGPGAIIASVTIGSGETLFASRAGAIFGYGLLWFIVLCAVCKTIQVYTGGRYMVLTGEHPMEAWARLPGPRGWFPALLGGMSVLCFPFWIGALSLLLGTVLNWIFGIDERYSPEQQQAYQQMFATGMIAVVILFTLIQSYAVFEKVQTVIVAVLLLAILAGVFRASIDWLAVVNNTVAIHMPSYPEWIHTEYPEIVEKESVLLAMVVFMMAIGGGTYDYIGYLSFFRDKKWGGLGTTSAGSTSLTAHPVIDVDDEVNLARARGWLRAPMVDIFAGFFCVGVFTIAFNVLGAAILHPDHKVPQNNDDLLTLQAAFVTQFGESFKYLYQVGILMAIWGTLYGAFEIYSRTAYECFRPLSQKVRQSSFTRMRVAVCIYAGLGGLVLAWTVQHPLDIVKPIGPIAMLTCGIWCFAMIWADRRWLPKPLQMNPAWLLGNLVAGVIMGGFGGKAMLDVLMK